MKTHPNSIGPVTLDESIIDYILEQVADELGDETMKDRVQEHVAHWSENQWRAAAVQAEFDIEAAEWTHGKPSYEDLQRNLKRILSKYNFPEDEATLNEEDYQLDWKETPTRRIEEGYFIMHEAWETGLTLIGDYAKATKRLLNDTEEYRDRDEYPDDEQWIDQCLSEGWTITETLIEID